MQRWMWLILILSLSGGVGRAADSPAPTSAVSADPMHCAAFSPYVGQLNPDWGAHPSPELIDSLLDRLIAQTPFRCIMTYGVTNGLEHTFAAARARGLKVIAIIWLDRDRELNSQSISAGIAAARTYSDTIVKLACGSEVRTRHSKALDSEIVRCLDAFREAGVRQPLTTIDTWWEWCDRTADCQPTEFANKVDWIGANIFPWWENKFSGLYPCTSAEQAADFHIARLSQLRKTYPDKPVVVTEFGWPSGPENGTEINGHTGQHCGVASPANQALVVNSTLAKLAEKGWSGVVFEAFAENWKPGNEGLFGSYWGICAGQAPYTCQGIRPR